MRKLAAIALLLAACTEVRGDDCNFRNAACPADSFCMGHVCRLADTGEAYPFSFLLVPPDGAATAAQGAFVPTPAPDPGAERRLVVCPSTRVSVDPSENQVHLVAVGAPLEGLPFRSVVEQRSDDAQAGSVFLPPGTWDLYAGFLGASAPVYTRRQVPPCLDRLTLSFQSNVLLDTVSVEIVVDAGRDDRPFCDARIAVVDAAGHLRSSEEKSLEQGCTGGAILAYAPGPDLRLRVRPRDDGSPTIATQLLPLPPAGDTITVSAVGPAGPPRRFTVRVENTEGLPVEADLSAEGVVVDWPRPWPNAERPATFVTSRSDPIPRERGAYTIDLVPGCYRLTAVPPTGSLSGVGHNAPHDASQTFPAACPPGSARFDRTGPSELTLVLPDRVSVDGTVSRGSGEAVPGARVTAVPTRGPGREVATVTDVEGHFTLLIDKGASTSGEDYEYDLLVQPPAGSNLPWTRLPVSSQSRLNPILPDPQWIRGSVVDPEGQPVPRTIVKAYGAPLERAPRPIGEAITDEDGNFTLVLPSCLQCAGGVD